MRRADLREIKLQIIVRQHHGIMGHKRLAEPLTDTGFHVKRQREHTGDRLRGLERTGIRRNEKMIDWLLCQTFRQTICLLKTKFRERRIILIVSGTMPVFVDSIKALPMPDKIKRACFHACVHPQRKIVSGSVAKTGG
jgi:hypothetical protein